MQFTVLLLLLALAAAGQTYQLNGRDVQVFTGKDNWFKASETCLKRGMRLLSIKSSNENKEVVGVAKDYGMNSTWIAANDLGESRRWTWSHCGVPVNETYWQQGEPSDVDMHCVEAVAEGHSHNWKVINCHEQRAFICEQILPEVVPIAAG